MNFLDALLGLENKTVLITGAGGVLCSEIAIGYAQAGANVVLCGRRKEALEFTADKIIKKDIDPAKIAIVQADLEQEIQVETAFNESVCKFESVDILFNGVGGNSLLCPFIDVEQKQFESILRLNLLAGCILPTKYAVKYWIKQAIHGIVINMASMGSFNPLPGAWAYSAAKAAVVNQTKAQARELAQYGIRVNAIAPGFFIGEQNRRLLINDDGTLTNRGENVINRTSMKRFGIPHDLVAAAIFLASDGAGFISGAVLPVDGAYLCSNI